MSPMARLAPLFRLLPAMMFLTPALAELPRSAPEAQGVASAAVRRFVERADRDGGGFHSVMIVRHGHVIAEGWWAPYSADRNHELYSLSKSFTSTAVGIAVGEGRLSLDDPVLKFFPDEAPPEPVQNLKSMRVRDLLRMATGHQDEPPSGPDRLSPATFLAHPVPHKPGTHFRYNTPATFMLSAIVQRQTGQTVLEYLRPRLFEPLGIAHPAWGTNFQGVSLGGWGLRVRTGDIARFGQLLLQDGVWDGRRLLPGGWVAEATGLQTANGSAPSSDWDQGYGYQFWRCRHGAYRGDGAFGQYCIVLPREDAVVAITAGAANMQAMLDLVWSELLPALGSAALPPDPAAHEALRTTLAGLQLARPAGGATPPVALRPVLGRRHVLPGDHALAFQALRVRQGDDGTGTVLEVESGGRTVAIPCDPAGWRAVAGPVGIVAEPALLASGAWTAPDVLTVRLCAVETPHVLTLTLRFADGGIACEGEFNVRFGPGRLPSARAVPGPADR